MLGFPVFYFFLSILLFSLQARGLFSVLLSPVFYLTSIFWVVTGVGLRRMNKWTWGTFLIAQALTMYLNIVNLISYSDSEAKGFSFLVILLVQSYIQVVISRHLRVPYLFPKIKWWESGLAAIQNIPAEVFHVSSITGTSTGQILDIGPTGSFIKTPYEFEAFEKIKVRIQAYQQEVDLPGVVVWRAESTVTHPRGIGVEFGTLDRIKKRKLRVITKCFQKERNQRSILTPVPTGPE